jgi:hypothetical protein
MKLGGILLARYFAFIETTDLNPRGKAYFPDLVNAAVERYGFAKFPQKIEDFDEKKGVSFEAGRAGDFTIHKVVIHDHAIYVDTSSSTADSERLLHEMLSWLSKDHGLTFEPEMLKRCTYVSQLTFYSEGLLEKLNPALSKLSDKLSSRVPEYFKQPLKFHPSSVISIYDPLSTKQTPAQFSIERRADTLFSEHKYFSGAPLPTEEHIALLEEFEADLNRK